MAIGSEIASLWVKLGADISDFESKMNKAVSKVQQTGRGLTSAGMGLAKAITVPLALASGVAAKAAIDFESAFAGVRKTVNATEEQFDALRKGILDMSTVVPASAKEIAGIAEVAGQLGIRQGDILAFTRTMVDLGETTDLVATEGAKALARFMNVMGTAPSDVRRLGDTIVDLGNNFATTESEIVEMAQRLSGAGAVVGLTEAQVLGLATALSSVGLRADAGGTAVSKVFIEISKAVSKGGKTLQQFAGIAGMTSADFTRAFEDDAAGAVVTFIEGLGKLGDAGGDVFGVLDQLGIQERRMIDALLRTANAGDIVRRAIEDGGVAWQENTALTAEAEKRYETTAAKLEMARNSATKFAVAAGQTLKDAISSLVVPLRGLFDWLTKLAESFNLLPDGIRFSIGAFVALVGVIPLVLVGLGQLARAFVAVSEAATIMGITTKRALITSGIGVALIAFGYAALEITRNWDKLKVFFLTVWDGIVLAAAKGVDQFLAVVSLMSNWVPGMAADVAVLRKALSNIIDERAASMKFRVYKHAADKMAADVTAVMEQLDKDILDIAMQSADMGDGFNIAAAKVTALEKAIESLRKQGSRPAREEIERLEKRLAAARKQAAEFGQGVKTATPPILDFTGGAAEASAVLDELEGTLREAAARQMVLGHEFNAGAAAVDALQDAMIELARLGIDPQSAKYAELSAQLHAAREASEAFKRSQETRGILSQLGDEFDTAAVRARILATEATSTGQSLAALRAASVDTSGLVDAQASDIMRELRAELERVDERTAQLGTDFDVTARKAKLIEGAMRDMILVGLEPSSDALRTLRDELTMLDGTSVDVDTSGAVEAARALDGLVVDIDTEAARKALADLSGRVVDIDIGPVMAALDAIDGREIGFDTSEARAALDALKGHEIDLDVSGVIRALDMLDGAAVDVDTSAAVKSLEAIGDTPVEIDTSAAEAALDALQGAGIEIDSTGVADAVAGLDAIEAKYGSVAGSVDEARTRVSALTTALVSLSQQDEPVDPDVYMRLARWLRQAREDAERLGRVDRIDAIYEGVTDSLEDIAAKHAALGSQIDVNAEKARILESAMLALAAEGVDPSSAGFAELREQLAQTLEATLATTQPMSAEFLALVDRVAELRAAAADLGSVPIDTAISDVLTQLDADLLKLDERQKMTGETSKLTAERIAVITQALIALRMLGLEPSNEAFTELVAKLEGLTIESTSLEDFFSRTTDAAASWAVQLEAEISRGLKQAAFAFLEGVGQMAAGEQNLRGVISNVMSTLAEMAVRVGKIAVGTGIAVKGIKESLRSLNPAVAIAAGAALIVLGSAVKAKLAASANPGGGGTASFQLGNTNLGNFTPSLPPESNAGAGSGSPTPSRDRSQSTIQLAEPEQKQELSVQIIPRKTLGGDLEYIAREGTRRAKRYGTDVI